MDQHVCSVAVVTQVDVVRAGLVAILGEHPDRIRVIDASTGFGAEDPHVILYDVFGLHEGNGSDLEALVKETTSAVLAVSRELRPDLGSRALALGADGFLPLEIAAGGLVDAVVATCTGASAIDGGKGFDAREHALGHDVGLTAREVDVLSLITKGYSNQEIAQQTYLSINSVKTYIRTAYRRIGATSRSQAVVWCLQHGFATESE